MERLNNAAPAFPLVKLPKTDKHLVFYLITPPEPLYPPCGINHLELSGEEWMTLTAYLYLHCLPGGAGSEGITAGT